MLSSSKRLGSLGLALASVMIHHHRHQACYSLISKPLYDQVPKIFNLRHRQIQSLASTSNTTDALLHSQNIPNNANSRNCNTFPLTSITHHQAILRSYFSDHGAVEAFRHYRLFIKDVEPFNHSLPTFRLLVKGLLDHDLPDLAIQAKDDMFVRVYYGPDLHVYRLIMTWFVDHGKPGEALTLFRELRSQVMPANGFLDELGYVNLIIRLLENKRKDVAWGWYCEAFRSEEEFRLEPVSYNAVLEPLMKDFGDLDEAVSLFRRMVVAHRPPKKPVLDIKSFDVVVAALCCAKEFDEAVDLFRELAKIKCRPDPLLFNKFLETSSCNRLIQNLVGYKRFSEAEEVLCEMTKQEIPRNKFTYLYLVEAYFSAGRITDGIARFKDMMVEEHEMMLQPPDANSYNKVIFRLASALESHNMTRVVLDEMAGWRMKLSIEGYDLLTKAFCKSGRMNGACKTVVTMLLDQDPSFTREMKELAEAALREDAREEELARLFDYLKREKSAAAEEDHEEENTEGYTTRLIHQSYDELKWRISLESYSTV